MPKKHKFVKAVCHAKQCGNYDRLYKNHCRALTGKVAIYAQDCYAFMTKEQAARIDRAAQIRRNKHKNMTAKLRKQSEKEQENDNE